MQHFVLRFDMVHRQYDFRQDKSDTKQIQHNHELEADKTEESLTVMIANAMEKQQQFIEAQIKTLQDRDIKGQSFPVVEMGLRELCDRYSSLSSWVGKAEKNYDKSRHIDKPRGKDGRFGRSEQQE